MASPDTLQFIFKLVPEASPEAAAPKPPDDNGVFALSLSLASGKGDKGHPFTNVVKKPGADKLKFHPENAAAPGAADCFLQLWELDEWMESGSTKSFDAWYKVEDEDVADGAGGNRLIGSLGGCAVQVGKKAWEFQVLDDSGLKEASKDQPFLSLKYKLDGKEVVKKVAIDVVNESRWDIGLFPTPAKDEKRWEKTRFAYPPYFIDSMRNLVRMQLAEGGLTVACFGRLNREAEEETRKRYRYYLKELETQAADAKAQVSGRLDAIFAKAKELRKQAGKPELEAAKAAAAREELGKAIEGRSGAYRKALPFERGHGAENAAKWMERIKKAMGDLQAAARKTCWEKIKDAFALDEAQSAKFTGNSEISFYQGLGFSKVEEDDPAKGEPWSGKGIYDIFNDTEFPNNSAELSREFGFLTLDEKGEPAKGAKPLESLADLVPHLRAMAEAVAKKYPELPESRQAKIFRFVMFTHGSSSAGLKFPDGWFGVDDLSAAAGKKILDELKEVLAPECVITLFACSTGGNPKVKTLQKRILKQAEKANKEKRDEEKAGLTEKDAKELKQLRSEIDARYKLALARETKEKLAEWKALDGYRYQLVSYGGDPDSKAELRNIMGEGSFARLLRDNLKDRGVEADVWSHTDPGHTSRNARLRVFGGNGEVHDLVRLVFAETPEFKAAGEPTKAQLRWWWGRGGETMPLKHQHAVKKATLCRLSSLTTDTGGFSLKKVVSDFRKWHKE